MPEVCQSGDYRRDRVKSCFALCQSRRIFLKAMTADYESLARLVYRKGTNDALGPDWDVMQVVYQREEYGVMRTAASDVREVTGAIAGYAEPHRGFPAQFGAITRTKFVVSRSVGG